MCVCTLHQQLNGSTRRCTTWFIEHVVSDRWSSMRGFRLHGVFRSWLATGQFRRPSQHSCLCTCIRKDRGWLLDLRTIEPSADVVSMSSTVQVASCSRVELKSTQVVSAADSLQQAKSWHKGQPRSWRGRQPQQFCDGLLRPPTMNGCPFSQKLWRPNNSI